MLASGFVQSRLLDPFVRGSVEGENSGGGAEALEAEAFLSFD